LGSERENKKPQFHHLISEREEELRTALQKYGIFYKLKKFTFSQG
jgi:hypothetical protein